MKAPWIALALVILTSTAAADTDQQIIEQAVQAKAVTEKLEACLKREPLERSFIKMCMMAATTFAEVHTYTRSANPDQP